MDLYRPAAIDRTFDQCLLTVPKKRRFSMENQEIKATWGQVVRVWWALLWRNIIASLIAMIIGIVIGALIGFVLGFFGVPQNIIGIIGGIVGGIIGLAVSLIPVKLVLGKDFGEFRLVIVPKQE